MTITAGCLTPLCFSSSPQNGSIITIGILTNFFPSFFLFVDFVFDRIKILLYAYIKRMICVYILYIMYPFSHGVLSRNMLSHVMLQHKHFSMLGQMLHGPNCISLYNIPSRLVIFNPGCTSHSPGTFKEMTNLSPAPRGFGITEMVGAQVWAFDKISPPLAVSSRSGHQRLCHHFPAHCPRLGMGTGAVLCVSSSMKSVRITGTASV